MDKKESKISRILQKFLEILQKKFLKFYKNFLNF